MPLNDSQLVVIMHRRVLKEAPCIFFDRRKSLRDCPFYIKAEPQKYVLCKTCQSDESCADFALLSKFCFTSCDSRSDDCTSFSL